VRNHKQLDALLGRLTRGPPVPALVLVDNPVAGTHAVLHLVTDVAAVVVGGEGGGIAAGAMVLNAKSPAMIIMMKT